MTTNRSRQKPQQPLGSIAFVGAGPGDPGLLTVRACDLLATADVVVHDSGIPAAVLRRAGGCPRVVPAGPAADGRPLPPAARAQLAIDAAAQGLRVVRLCEGDPGLFGGLAEEASACAAAAVPFEVVPGVSVVTAVPTYAGLPLSGGRDGEVRVVDAARAGVDWARHCDPHVTLVLLGALGVLGDVAAALVAAGRPASTPVAITRAGTTTAQTTLTSTLGDVAADARASRFTGPALTVVGDAVAQRPTLSWFETKPLFGWRVLVPRTKEQAAALSDRLGAHGAVPVEVPTISVEPPRTPQQMDRAVQGLVSGRYLWVAFTSVNAVRAVRERLEEYGLDARAFAGVKIAAVGEQTAAALRTFGVKPDLTPQGEQSSAGLLEEWPVYDPVFDPIDRVFLPRADIATETLSAGLLDLGWEVDDVTAYRTVRAAPPPAETREAIKGGGFDAVVFTSSSTVRNLVGIAGKPHASTVIACIGPATAKTAEEHGLRVEVLAPEPSAVALVDALAEYGAAQRLLALEHGETVWRPSLRRHGSRRRAR
ncbi:MAG: bifunctional uroporphyrinogen-III C-methyltransferase/uroporphyrinogen-III synthase [Actinomycetia bacterium]|nr:bifunctional uroporphyrinogen-III C-methyltransferase/uroporphyrinogen-III synthase [Actinomycetes bacterium]